MLAKANLVSLARGGKEKKMRNGYRLVFAVGVREISQLPALLHTGRIEHKVRWNLLALIPPLRTALHPIPHVDRGRSNWLLLGHCTARSRACHFALYEVTPPM